MMMKKGKYILTTLCVFVIISSCKKEPEPTSKPAEGNINLQILAGVSTNVVQATYNDLNIKADALYQNVVALQSSVTDADLTKCKQSWKDARSAWEQSEGFLFGPVATNDIDPRIDTWPVAFGRLDSVLSSTAVFSSAYVDSLEDALKGFHPIEYLLFGKNGNKNASQLTVREMDYLKALTFDLRKLVMELADTWNPVLTNNYHSLFVNPGSGNNTYASKRAVFEEMVNAMAGICDEVANGKLAEPFTKLDPSLEESPFSSNSITDFTSNIKSVQNVYFGKYINDGKGIEDLVRQYNLSLDGNIKTKLSTALAALQGITVPFGQAITQQPNQVSNAITAINELKDVIENNLLPFVQQYGQ